MYHLSQSKGLKILFPSKPSEERVGNEIKWDENYKPCVCFGLNSPEEILKDVPMLKGYIYTHIEKIQYREFYKESRTTTLSQYSKEIRVYSPVKVKCIGEFEMLLTESGLRPKIKYYKKQKNNKN